MSSDRSTIFKSFLHSAQLYHDRHCFGKRSVSPDGSVSFNWITYSEALNLIEHLSSFLSSLDLSPGDRVGIMSCSRVDWQLFDLANHRSGLVTVGVYESVRPEDQLHIFQDSDPSVLIYSSQCRSSLQYILSHFSKPLKAIISLDEADEFSTHTYSSIIDLPLPKVEPAQVSGSDLATLVYSSGTAGRSKGAMLTHTNVLSGALSYNLSMPPFPTPDHQEVTLAYLPLSHVFERVFETAALFHGSRIAFFSGDTSTLVSDIALVQPTIFTAVPRVLAKIYNGIVRNLNNTSCVSRLVFNTFLHRKMRRQLRNRDTPLITSFFKNKIASKVWWEATYRLLRLS
ncbi:hypothetical protein GEMRC1_012360 [Eukaryota sp. GEM-RC1]